MTKFDWEKARKRPEPEPLRTQGSRRPTTDKARKPGGIRCLVCGRPIAAGTKTRAVTVGFVTSRAHVDCPSTPEGRATNVP